MATVGQHIKRALHWGTAGPRTKVTRGDGPTAAEPGPIEQEPTEERLPAGSARLRRIDIAATKFATDTHDIVNGRFYSVLLRAVQNEAATQGYAFFELEGTAPEISPSLANELTFALAVARRKYLNPRVADHDEAVRNVYMVDGFMHSWLNQILAAARDRGVWLCPIRQTAGTAGNAPIAGAASSPDSDCARSPGVGFGRNLPREPT